MCSWRICGNATRTPQGLSSRLWCIKTLLEKSFSLLVKNDPKPRKGKQPTEREDAGGVTALRGKVRLRRGRGPAAVRAPPAAEVHCGWPVLWRAPPRSHPWFGSLRAESPSRTYRWPCWCRLFRRWGLGTGCVGRRPEGGRVWLQTGLKGRRPPAETLPRPSLYPHWCSP